MLILNVIQSNFALIVKGLSDDSLHFFARDIRVLPSSRNVPAAPFVVLFVNSYKYIGALHLMQNGTRNTKLKTSTLHSIHHPLP